MGAAVRRSWSAAELEAVALHPEVSPWSLRAPAGDLAPLLADTRNLLLIVDGGAFYCRWLWDGAYEFHMMFLPHTAGVITKIRAALDWMFQHDATELHGPIAADNSRATRIARHFRFWPNGVVGEWRRAGAVHDVIDWVMTREAYHG